MNKSQLIDALAARFDGNKKAAAHALESVLDTITREIARGEKVAITGFGSFEKRLRPERTVRNPQTGEEIRTRKTFVPKFNAGADLKNVVSGVKKLPKLALTTLPGKKVEADTSDSSAPVKVAAAKGATAKKTSAATKTTAAKKAPVKKAPVKKATAKKATAKKATAAKATTTKAAPAKVTASSGAAAQTSKKSTAKKSTAKKSSAKTTATKTTATTSAAKKSATPDA
ncbi:hypothetical protein GCM10009798_24010 [Nocardioides panacihumi]|uniref:HU family DNA-binding protein n=1 Tax=Nocardioides panacihumi TaxID=400774 RepID=A0ABN2R401_9ACTN